MAAYLLLSFGGNKLKEWRILIVEDEAILAMELEMKLKSNNFENIKIASTGAQTVEYAKNFKPDVILMDIMLKDKMNSIEAAQQILIHQTIPIIYITGNIHLKEDKKLIATNPVAVLNKPCMEWEMLNSIELALNRTKKSTNK